MTYITTPSGFVYLAAILDAWLRKVVGYAISRSKDARIAVTVLGRQLKAIIRRRAAFTTRIADQYASEIYRALLNSKWLGRVDEPLRQSMRQG